MSLRAARLRYQKKGFRAKLSNGWFVVDDVAGRPVAGPFDHRSEARMERDRLHKGRVMKEQKERETVKETSTTSTDQSDSESAKNTSDGSSPSDGREEEVIDESRRQRAGGGEGE